MSFVYPAIWISVFWFVVWPHDYFFTSLYIPLAEAVVFCVTFVVYHIGKLLPFFNIIDERLKRN